MGKPLRDKVRRAPGLHRVRHHRARHEYSFNLGQQWHFGRLLGGGCRGAVKLAVVHDSIRDDIGEQVLVVSTRLIAGNVLPSMLHQDGADVLVFQFDGGGRAVIQLWQQCAPMLRF